MSEATNSMSPEPRSDLLGLLTEDIIEWHEKPVRDAYREDLEALGDRRGDAHSRHAGAWDRKSLEETARLKLEA